MYSRNLVWRWRVYVSAAEHELLSWNNREVNCYRLTNWLPMTKAKMCSRARCRTHWQEKREGDKISYIFLRGSFSLNDNQWFYYLVWSLFPNTVTHNFLGPSYVKGKCTFHLLFGLQGLKLEVLLQDQSVVQLHKCTKAATVLKGELGWEQRGHVGVWVSVCVCWDGKRENKSIVCSKTVTAQRDNASLGGDWTQYYDYLCRHTKNKRM